MTGSPQAVGRRVLVLGGNGMLGHKLCQVLAPDFDVTATIRGPEVLPVRQGLRGAYRVLPGIDVTREDGVESALGEVNPTVVVNAVGIVKSLERQAGRETTIAVNALFPHRLHRQCLCRGIRLIHISTDCVFSGRNGVYTEDSLSDAEDAYGRSKYLGEVIAEDALTIRTSFIGREPVKAGGLVEWLLANSGGAVNGYINAIFSGFPSLHLARILADIIADHPDLQGLYHVSSEPIDKYRLLVMINDALGLNVDIRQYADFHCDRSLDSTQFRSKTGFLPQSWEEMISEFAEDARQYPERRMG